MSAQWNATGRQVVERIWIHGTLVLETPAHLGSGEPEALTDMPLLRDEISGRPLLTGTSLAGALRAYVREFEHGYGEPERRGDRARTLFGTVREGESVQSWLIVDDALGNGPGVELRDGVALDPATRTAADQAKYDIELLQAGTTFDIELELLLPASAPAQREKMVETLALALHGLEQGEIGLGMRKRRGLGACRVTEWRVCRYALTDPAGLVAWLDNDRTRAVSGAAIGDLLRVDFDRLSDTDAREHFAIDATMELEGSLLIRDSGAGTGTPGAPDMVHLHSYRPDEEEPVPVLSGTSLAGALRARALRIANTLLDGQGQALVDKMFGPRHTPGEDGEDPAPAGSRVVVYERELTGSDDLVQQRVKIDRFTGGAYPQALFAQQPLFADPDTTVKVELELRAPQDDEIGLLLLVLKDLWTGDLPLGGEQSVGRGRLQGRSATLTLRRRRGTQRWTLAQAEADPRQLVLGGESAPEALEAFVTELHAHKPRRDA